MFNLPLRINMNGANTFSETAFLVFILGLGKVYVQRWTCFDNNVYNWQGDDVMWEIYATLAPLEAVIQPVILDNVVTLAREIMPRAYCPMKVGLQKT